MGKRSLVLVHAHPDDESMFTGGTMARYAADGVHVCLITCTNGEVGEIADVPDLGTLEEVAPRLGEIRREELEEACRRLGQVDLRMLGFHDSGMDGTPENNDPKAFVNQPLDQPVRLIVKILRELKPQILITYNERGFYGHPDHIRSHEAALAAVEAAKDAAYAPELGESHAVSKVYYNAVPTSLLREGKKLAEEMLEGSEEFFSESDIALIGTDDRLVTTEIDVGDWVKTKFYALEAHRTQLGTTQGWFDIPEDVRSLMFGMEFYVLRAAEEPQKAEREKDLFDGVSS
jgi:N-acetyl-1-D-myo-inositol-2-amino-2-deoxy-alpha-D-glucopyranoside deacetylase